MQDKNSSVCGIFGYFQGELVSKVGMTVGWVGRDKEELLSTVRGDGLCDKRCRALTASHVNVFTEAVIGHIHLA